MNLLRRFWKWYNFTSDHYFNEGMDTVKIPKDLSRIIATYIAQCEICRQSLLQLARTKRCQRIVCKKMDCLSIHGQMCQNCCTHDPSSSCKQYAMKMQRKRFMIERILRISSKHSLILNIKKLPIRFLPQ